MAAITVTQVGNRQFVGDEVELTLLASAATGVASATEWFSTGLSSVTKVVGFAILGTGGATVNFVKNAQGTGVTAGTNQGDLGVEASAAVVIEVTVRGRAI